MSRRTKRGVAKKNVGAETIQIGTKVSQPPTKGKANQKKTTKSSAIPKPRPPKAPIAKKVASGQLADEVVSVIEEEEYIPTEIQKKTSPHMSPYEYCALISARVAQLTSRSTEWNMPKIPIETPEDHDPLIIATKEVKERLVSLVVRRRLPDGSTEDWLLQDMIFPRI